LSPKSNLEKPATQSSDSGGIGTCWLGNAPVFAFGDGRLLIDGKTYAPHSGGILSMTYDAVAGTVFTCGDDGAVIATNAQGQCETVLEVGSTWLDVIAFHQSTRRISVSIGREVLVHTLASGPSTQIRLKPARAATSLAFSGDGTLLAVGHSAGVSLFKLSQPQAPLYEFPCSGGPVSVALDYKGNFLFAGLSEPALAGWRLRDGQGFRMGGYPGKPRHLLWTSKEQALLTTGGPALLVWPMIGKDGRTRVGPMGQAAGVYRPRLGMVTAIATHGEIALVGWSDGGVDLVNLVEGTSRYIGGAKPVSTLDNDPRASTYNIAAIALRSDGKHAAWVSETGSYGTAVIQ
jgi:WD40 repeat protein